MNALILMTRIPIPGQTKTRLMDIMSGYERADLHLAFLMDLFHTFKKVRNKVEIYLTYTPENSFKIIDDMIPGYIKTFPQKGEDLGEKMYHAIKHVLSIGYENVILIGADIPDLSAEDINTAFRILENKDLIFGPSYDGGYYLVGMKKPNKKIFDISKNWGEKSVLESTVDIANNLGLSIGLAPKYRDIDTKEDLFEFMKKHENDIEMKALYTTEFVRRWRETID